MSDLGPQNFLKIFRAIGSPVNIQGEGRHGESGFLGQTPFDSAKLLISLAYFSALPLVYNLVSALTYSITKLILSANYLILCPRITRVRYW
jgi:hypothetical protein